MLLILIINMRSFAIHFNEVCSRQWEVNLSHIYRQANNTADYLANFGHSLNYGLHIFVTPDRDQSH
ncbi:hypothetical protein LINGRAHAP2_LOCUS23089 [Linum grandiflorum]